MMLFCCCNKANAYSAGNNRLYAINLATAAATQLETVEPDTLHFGTLALDRANNIMYAGYGDTGFEDSGWKIFTVDRVSGASVELFEFDITEGHFLRVIGESAPNLTFNPVDGLLYFLTFDGVTYPTGDHHLCSLDPGDGTFTDIGAINGHSGALLPYGLAFNSSGECWFMNRGTGVDNLYRLDTTDASVQETVAHDVDFGTGTVVLMLAFSADDTLYWLIGSGGTALREFDWATNTFTLIGNAGTASTGFVA